MHIKNSIFFHEDNFCQIELLPIQNILIRNNEISSAKSNFYINYTDNGFINMTSRNQAQYPLIYLNINCNNFKTVVEPHSLFYFDNIYTGYSNQRSYKKNINAFGFENYILYYEFKDNIIVAIWIDYNPISDTLNIFPAKLEKILFELGKLYDLILIDWNELKTIILKDRIALLEYVKDVL